MRGLRDVDGGEVPRGRGAAFGADGDGGGGGGKAGKVRLPADQARAVSRLLAYHITQQLGKRLKMERHAVG